MSSPLTFIISTGRCGSTFLGDQLAASPLTAVASELSIALEVANGPDSDHAVTVTSPVDLLRRPNPILALLGRYDLLPSEVLDSPANDSPALLFTAFPSLFGPGQPAASALDDLLTDAEDWPHEPTVQVLARTMQWIQTRTGARCLVERSGASLAAASTLVETFGHARFLHLHRSGVGVARSMAAHPVFKLDALRRKVAAQHRVDIFAPDLSAAVQEQLVDEYGPLFPFAFHPDRFVHHFPLGDTHFGTLWSLMMMRGCAALNTLPPEQLRHVSYESLGEAPHHVGRQISAFVGLPADDPWVAALAADIRPSTAGAPSPALERACALGERIRARLAPATLG